MKPSVGRQTCDCCRDIYNQEFQKIVELKHAGISIYRYIQRTREGNQIDTEEKEIFLLRNIRDEDLKLEDFIVELGKTNISCPRCLKLIDRAEKLFKNLPKVNIREVSGVCHHCYMRQRLHCPCCERVVDKFLTFCKDDRQLRDEKRQRVKSWLMKTQTLLKQTLLSVQDYKLEPRAQSEGRIRDTNSTKFCIDHENAAMTARSIPSTIHVTRPSKPSSLLKIATEIKGKSKQSIKKITVEEEESERSLKIPTQMAQIPPFLKYAKDRVKSDQLEKEIETLLKEATFLDFTEDLDVVKKSQRVKTAKNLRVKSEYVRLETYSVDTFRKTSSEDDVSVFRFVFPETKIAVREPIKGHVSSSELIKNTLDTLQEIAEAEKKKREEELRKRREEEERKKNERDKKRGILSQNKSSVEKHEIEKSRSIEITKFIMESSILLPTAKSSLSQGLIAETIKHESKSILRKDDTAELIGPIAKKTKVQKPVIKDKDKLPIEVNPDDVNWLGKSENVIEKKTQPKQETKVDEQHAKQAKENLKEQKEGKTQRKVKDLEEKKNERKQKPPEKKEKHTESKPLEKNETLQVKTKQPDQKRIVENKDAIAPRTDFKKANVELTEGKEEGIDRKKQEKDRKSGEKKDKQLENNVEGKQVPVISKPEMKTEKEKSHQKVREPKRKTKDSDVKTKDLSKPEIQSEEEKPREKIKELERKTKEPDVKTKDTEVKTKDPDHKVNERTAKEQKQHDTAAATILREQLAELKQHELEAERNRKEQEKEREMTEKKLREHEITKIVEIKEATIKPPTLEPEYDVSSYTGDIDETITKPDENTHIIIGDQIFHGNISDQADKHEQATFSEPAEKLKYIAEHTPEEPKQPKEKSRHSSKQFIGKNPEPVKELSAQTVKIEQQPEKIKNDREVEQPRQVPRTADNRTKLPLDPEASKGVIRYALSDCTFIDKGWTMLPTEKVVRKMNVYRMRPAKPEFDWFEHNKYKRAMTYDTGELLAEFDENGRGRWYYRNGKLALDYYDAEEINAGQRFVVYSSGEPDERGRSRPRTVLATFDYLGNGIVFDHSGKIRLKYNQTEGVVLDRAIGPPSHWKWHTLNDPPILQQVMIDTQMPYKDPKILKMGDKISERIKRPENEEMLAIEFENFLKEKSQKLTQSFKPFQIRMKAMKINENFSLRVLDQASVYLLFRDGTTNLKINIGMVLDHKEILDIDTAEIGEVSNTLDKLPACTDSIAGLQRAVARAQAHERSRVRHESHLKRFQLSNSVDELRAGCSRPLHPPPFPCSSATSISKTTPSRFKPSCCNLYYSTQL